MGHRLLHQSSLGRAWSDTGHSFHTRIFFGVVEVMTVGTGVFIGTYLMPDNATKFESAAYPTIGMLIGVLAGLLVILLVNWILAPYRQRNEARRHIESLISKSTSVGTSTSLEQIRAFISEGRGLLPRCVAKGILPPEVVVANWVKRIRDHIEEHYDTGYAHIWDRWIKGSPTIKRPTGMETPAQLQLLAIVTRGIDKLQEYEEELDMSTGLTPDKEDSQT